MSNSSDNTSLSCETSSDKHKCVELNTKINILSDMSNDSSNKNKCYYSMCELKHTSPG